MKLIKTLSLISLLNLGVISFSTGQNIIKDSLSDKKTSFILGDIFTFKPTPDLYIHSKTTNPFQFSELIDKLPKDKLISTYNLSDFDSTIYKSSDTILIKKTINLNSIEDILSNRDIANDDLFSRTKFYSNDLQLFYIEKIYGDYSEIYKTNSSKGVITETTFEYKEGDLVLKYFSKNPTHRSKEANQLPLAMDIVLRPIDLGGLQGYAYEVIGLPFMSIARYGLVNDPLLVEDGGCVNINNWTEQFNCFISNFPGSRFEEKFGLPTDEIRSDLMNAGQNIAIYYYGRF